MFTSFNTALSALNANTTAIDVVGNNLANLNTTAYKISGVSFSDLVTQSLGAGLGETQVGFGVAPPVTLREFSQGAIQSSTGPLDVAIQGDGFLIVKDPSANASLYTRGGNLIVNKQGEIATAKGDIVQGWNAAADGTIDTTEPTSAVSVPLGTLIPPEPTEHISLTLNLDPRSTVTPVTDPTTGATNTPNFSETMQIFDSLGEAHKVTISFWNQGGGQWSYQMSVPGTDFASGNAAVQTGTLSFDSQGTLTAPTATATPTLTLTGLKDGASDMTGAVPSPGPPPTVPAINWDLYSASGVAQLTQFAQTSSVSANSQDGAAAAQLTHVGIADGGNVVAQYSDGQEIVVGQLALAAIVNPSSLIAVGDNNYQLSSASSLPAVGLPNTGGRGQILGGSIEASNVDIAAEFTNLIVYQRAYEANSKVVTASDQLSQTTINLIRQ